MCRHIEPERERERETQNEKDSTIGVIFIDDDDLDEIREEVQTILTPHIIGYNDKNSDACRSTLPLQDQVSESEKKISDDSSLISFAYHQWVFSLLILIFDIRPYKPDSKAFFVRKSRRSDNAQTR